MSDNIFAIVSFTCRFPSSLWQHLDGSFSPVESARSVQHWKLADADRGVYELQDRPMSCEARLFERDDRGQWDMSDEEVGEYAI